MEEENDNIENNEQNEAQGDSEDIFAELPPKNSSQPNINSLFYQKLKGINRRCSLPEKKKNKNYSKFLDESEESGGGGGGGGGSGGAKEVAGGTDCENLLPNANDSMGLLRAKTKKQELKDSVNRLRRKSTADTCNNGNLNAALGNSNINDSMNLNINKKRATSAGSKLRKKVFGNKAQS